LHLRASHFAVSRTRPTDITLPALPLMETVSFPGGITNLILKPGFRRSAVERALSVQQSIFLVTKRSSDKKAPASAKDVFQIGITGFVLRVDELPNKSVQVRIAGGQRAKVLRLAKTGEYFEAVVRPLKERKVSTSVAGKSIERMLNISDELAEYFWAADMWYPHSWSAAPGVRIEHAGILCDVLAHNLQMLRKEKKQQVLETLDPLNRVRLLTKILQTALRELKKMSDLRRKVERQRKTGGKQAMAQEKQQQREHQIRMKELTDKLKQQVAEVRQSTASASHAGKVEVLNLPMMPVRDVVLLPGQSIPFVVGREASLAALHQALNGNQIMFMATQHDAGVDEPSPDEIFTTGVIGRIAEHHELPDQNVKVLVEVLKVAKILNLNDDAGYFQARVEAVVPAAETPAAVAGALATTRELLEQHPLELPQRQRLLEAFDPADPLKWITAALRAIKENPVKS
jgi:ATP-dependent Lon protease